jgi:hypothetical protein
MTDDVLDDQATPEVDVDVDAQQDPAAEDQTDPVPAKPEEPFLSVNERTVYKTREDAIRGANEAANRIAQLSGWEKRAKQYGLSTPEQLDSVATELLQLRKELADAKKVATGPKLDPADPKVKESAQVREYLKKEGFVSKAEQDEALKELRDQIAEMKQSGTRSEELRFQNQEAEARNDVASWLSSAGVKDDASGTKLQVVGTLVKDWINNDEERIERWSRGGVSAKSLVKEGFDQMLGALGWKPAVTPAAGQLKPTDPGYAAAKAKAVATNKKLPAPGTGRGHGDGTKPKSKPTGITPARHDEAWKLVQEAMK